MQIQKRKKRKKKNTSFETHSEIFTTCTHIRNRNGEVVPPFAAPQQNAKFQGPQGNTNHIPHSLHSIMNRQGTCAACNRPFTDGALLELTLHDKLTVVPSVSQEIPLCFAALLTRTLSQINPLHAPLTVLPGDTF
jgi:hypothetical protein